MDQNSHVKIDGIMRRIYLFAGILLAALLVMQFFRPEKNLGGIDSQEDFLQASEVPDTLARIFMNSCYDCHSNSTRYPWYGNIAPASWLMSSHIREAKEHLNFSTWGLMEKAKKISNLDKICDECSESQMPLKSYLVVHRTAKLSPREIEAICTWSEQEAGRVMSSRE
jgi:hypothetical protein